MSLAALARLCQVLLFGVVGAASVSRHVDSAGRVRENSPGLLRREAFFFSGAENAQLDEDRNALWIAESCGQSERLTDFAECRRAAAGFDLPFLVGRGRGEGLASCGFHGPSGAVLYSLGEDESKAICIRRASRMALRLDPVAEGSTTVFCFAWTTWKPNDLELLPEVRHGLRQCDGYRIFSDRQPFAGREEPDVTVVSVTQQATDRSDAQWLYHRNMVGLMPTWQHLLQSPEVEKYDWLLNLEFDHLLRVRQLRLSIATYLARLSSEAKAAETDPLLLMFGNAFLFNRGMVKDLKRQWSSLGRTAPPGHSASGCPMFMEGHFEWPQSCSQDIVYPTLVTLMSPPVGAFGAPGCGQPPGDPQLPLACFEFQRQPVHDTGLDQLSLVKEVAALARGPDAAAESSNATAALLRGAKDVPLFHHFSDPAARRAAVELLGA